MHKFFEKLPQQALLWLIHNSTEWTKLYGSLEVQVLASHTSTSAGDLLQMNIKYIPSSSSSFSTLLTKQRAQLWTKRLTRQAPGYHTPTDWPIRHKTFENRWKLNRSTPDCINQPWTAASLSWGNVTRETAASSRARQFLILQQVVFAPLNGTAQLVIPVPNTACPHWDFNIWFWALCLRQYLFNSEL